jgi:hypothetical protein
MNSDIVGRHELLFQWQGGLDESWQGTSLAFSSRASRLSWTLSGFMVRQGQFSPISTVLHGGAISIDASHRVETSFRRLSIGGNVSALQTSSGSDGLRALSFATLATGLTRYGDGTRTAMQVSATGVAGNSDGAAVRRGTVTATIELGPNPVVATGTAGAVNTTSLFEQFAVGGLTPVLLHPSVLSQRVAMPVLPTTYAIGKTLLTYRVSVPLLGARLYWWGAKVGNDSSARWQHVQGLEWSTAISQVSIVGTPAARITAGIGKWVDGPRAAPLLVNGAIYTPRQRSLTQLYIMTQLGDWAR